MLMERLLIHAGGGKQLGMRFYKWLSNNDRYWNTFLEYNYTFPKWKII